MSYRAALARRNRHRNPASGDSPKSRRRPNSNPANGLGQIVNVPCPTGDHHHRPHIAPRPPAAAPELRAADQGVADALESVLSDHTRRVYAAQWRLFVEWCDSVGLRSLLAEPFTVARYLAARANSGASIATCGSPPAPLPRRTSGRGSNRRVGTKVCVPL